MDENAKKLDLMYGEVLNRCWQDEAYLERFRKEPAAVLAEVGIPVKAGAAYHVMEQTQDKFFLILPQNYPAEKMEKLDELKAAAKIKAGLRDGTQIEVLQNSDTDVYLPCYLAPKAGVLSDDELDAVAGGIQQDPDDPQPLSMTSAWLYEQDVVVTHSLVASEIVSFSVVVG